MKDTSDNLSRYAAIGAGSVTILVAFFWLASVIFLGLIGVDPVAGRPWTGLVYALSFPDNKTVVDNLILSHAIPVGVIAAFLFLIFSPERKRLYGNAKFASTRDVKKAGLFTETGIALGKFWGKLLIMDENLHTLLSAPTRGGKGVAIVIPVCLSFPQSLVVLDTKHENYVKTSGFRKRHGQAVHLFNPMEPDFKTHRWNPLKYIPDSKITRINDIQKISMFLLPTPLTGDPMWSSEARKLFDGVVLMLLDLKQFPVTLGEVFRQLHTETETAEYLQGMIDEYRESLDSLCIMNLSSFINKPLKTRQGVLSTLTGALNIYSNPLVDAATSENDFDLRDIRKKKLTIYVRVAPGDSGQASAVINLFFQQLIDLNTRVLPEHDESLKYRCLLLMDEFTSIGRLPVLAKGIAFIAGYGLQLMPIIQSPSQLDETYTRETAKTMLKNFHIKLVYRPIDMEDATHIANELGYTTVNQTSKSFKSMDIFNTSKNVSETRRQLLLPQEVKDLSDKKVIILHWKSPPIMAKRFIYYKDALFKARLLPPVPVDPITVIEDMGVRGMRVAKISIDDIRLPSEIPSGRPLTDEEVSRAADEFFDFLKAAAS